MKTLQILSAMADSTAVLAIMPERFERALFDCARRTWVFEFLYERFCRSLGFERFKVEIFFGLH